MIISHVGGDQTTYSLEQDEFSINFGCKPFKGFVLIAANVKAARARYASGMISWSTNVDKRRKVFLTKRLTWEVRVPETHLLR